MRATNKKETQLTVGKMQVAIVEPLPGARTVSAQGGGTHCFLRRAAIDRKGKGEKKKKRAVPASYHATRMQ